MFWKITIMKFAVMKFAQGEDFLYMKQEVLLSNFVSLKIFRLRINGHEWSKWVLFVNFCLLGFFVKTICLNNLGNSDLFWVKKNLKYHNSNCSTKHTDLVGAEPGIVHKNAGYLPWDHSAKFSAGQCHSTNVNNNFEYDGLQLTNIYDLLLKMIHWMNYYIYMYIKRSNG